MQMFVYEMITNDVCKRQVRPSSGSVQLSPGCPETLEEHTHCYKGHIYDGDNYHVECT